MIELSKIRTSGGPARRPRPRPFPFEVFRRRRFPSGIACPRCRSSDVGGWGGYSGRRRYRCRACRRTFSDFTATPLAYLKKIESWPDHCASAMRSETLRREAARLKIHRDTAFRWRHKLLRAVDASDTELLRGIIATRETTFPVSEKGSRDLGGRARHRGWRFNRGGLKAPAVWVIIAQGSDGRVANGLSELQRPKEQHYARALLSRLAKNVRLTSASGAQGIPAVFAKRNGLAHVDPRLCEAQRVAVSTYVMRLRGWIRRFHGVATRYLANYLAWHRFLHTSQMKGEGHGVERLLTGSFA